MHCCQLGHVRPDVPEHLVILSNICYIKLWGRHLGYSRVNLCELVPAGCYSIDKGSSVDDLEDGTKELNTAWLPDIGDHDIWAWDGGLNSQGLLEDFLCHRMSHQVRPRLGRLPDIDHSVLCGQPSLVRPKGHVHQYFGSIFRPRYDNRPAHWLFRVFTHQLPVVLLRLRSDHPRQLRTMYILHPWKNKRHQSAAALAQQGRPVDALELY